MVSVGLTLLPLTSTVKLLLTSVGAQIGHRVLFENPTINTQHVGAEKKIQEMSELILRLLHLLMWLGIFFYDSGKLNKGP